MKNYDLVIVGGGPAGIMAGISAAAEGLKVCILEKKSKPARKLLITGAGRCNITHTGTLQDFFEHYGGRERFVKPALYSFPPEALTAFFHDRGVEFKELNEGKIFPVSEKSTEILKTLLTECEKLNVSIHNGESVSEVKVKGDQFSVTCDSGLLFESPRLVISTGGSSYAVTGSTGDGVKFAAAAGHRITAIKPALAPLVISDSPFFELSGISLKSVLTVFKDNKVYKRGGGDLLFTHKGFSGPLILNNSRYMDPGDMIEINFTGISGEDIRGVLTSPESASGGKHVKTALHSLNLPSRFLLAILAEAGIPSDKKLAELGKKKIFELVRLLTAHPFTIRGVGGWTEAMVTSGGVDISEVNPKTMESRIHPGLYFAGEVLDVDGDEGGYNLQYAFSSGYLAGKSAAQSKIRKSV
ncbi:MAG: NAD(P)/FAD-dependent oxidoreductase [Spirochaetales bacterium]|nr:NAD(P)/FAD-dependent oxidoreductase [Spirochaetales bacterium]